MQSDTRSSRLTRSAFAVTAPAWMRDSSNRSSTMLASRSTDAWICL